MFVSEFTETVIVRNCPVTPETVFHMASISKNILSAVVLQLVDEGKLRLDDDVAKYVPEAPTQGHHVTVGQLLNHTSGIYSLRAAIQLIARREGVMSSGDSEV